MIMMGEAGFNEERDSESSFLRDFTPRADEGRHERMAGNLMKRS